MKTRTKVNLTELELTVVEVLKGVDIPRKSITNLIDETGLTSQVLRGVLFSLILKKIVCPVELPNGHTGFYYIGK